jgi:hypothetical protein
LIPIFNQKTGSAILTNAEKCENKSGLNIVWKNVHLATVASVKTNNHYTSTSA